MPACQTELPARACSPSMPSRLSRRGWPGQARPSRTAGMDLSDLIARNAAFTPEKVALRYAGSSLTYAALARRIETAARALKSVLGVGRGDRVAILAANHPDYLVLLYACARLGALMVPLNWRLAVPEQLFILADASAKALIRAGRVRRGRARRCAKRSLISASFAWLTMPPPIRSRRSLPQERATRAIRTWISRARSSWSTPPAPPGARRVRCCARRPCCGTR